MKKIIIGSLFIAISLFADKINLIEVSKNNLSELPIENVEIIDLKDPIEPSGLTLDKNNIDILYIVSDNGYLCSYNDSTKEGNCDLINKNLDLEGITSINNEIYVANEGKDELVNLNNSNHFKIPRKIKDLVILGEKSSDGIEALTFLYNKNNKDYFAISNQSDNIGGNDSSNIIFFSKNSNNEINIEKVFLFNIIDISGLFYSNNNLLFISDTENILVKMNLDSYNTKTYNLPGKDQEGIVLNEFFNILYIAQDSGDILKFYLNKDL